MFSRAEGSDPRRPAAAPLVFLAGATGTRIVPPDYRRGAPSFQSAGTRLACRCRISIWLQVFRHKNLVVVVTILLQGVLFESIFHEAQTLI
jgi:hypothetical protein